jgi:hypothetical protein
VRGPASLLEGGVRERGHDRMIADHLGPVRRGRDALKLCASLPILCCNGVTVLHSQQRFPTTRTKGRSPWLSAPSQQGSSKRINSRCG